MVSCDEVLKVKPYTVVYTKERDDNEESVGSSFNVTIQGENGVPSSMEDNAELEYEDAKDAPPELEEGVKATIGALKEVNLGTDEEPRPTYLSVLLEVDEESTYIELLKEYRDVFAWSYKEMSGLDPKVAVHHLAVKNGARPVKQAQSIVPVRKKNGQIRVCVDFIDLNNACPKDEFPLPIPKLMIDATTGYENAGATYQRAMQNIFDDLLHKNVEYYVDDFVVVKRQVLADFLVDHPIPDDWELTNELPDEDAMVVEVQPSWKMYFDGAAHRERAGAGVVFVTSQGEVLPYSFTLTQFCSNNVVEYQALILGLETTVDMKKLQLQVFGDSQLVVNQLLGSYDVKKPELHPYYDYAKKLMGWLGDVTIQHMPRKENKKADALATLASSLTLPDQAQVTVCQKWVVPPPNEAEGEENELKYLVIVSEVEKEEWRQSIIDYLCYGILPENSRRRTEIYRRAPHFLYYKDTLYRRSFEGVLLRYLGEDETLQALQEAHSGYKACQYHANFSHQPPEVLHPTVTFWLFDGWGLDVVGPLPKSSGGNLYILDATDYFSKWAEVVALKEVKKEIVANFIRVNIIYRFGIPRYIITDNGKTFDNRLMNKAYRTTHRMPTQATPYSLVYGVEAVLPLERQIPSLRLAIQDEITDKENARLQLAELEALDEKRLEAQQSLECYQARLFRAFNKRVCPRSFQVGDQVLAVRRPIITSHKPVGSSLQNLMGHMLYKKLTQVGLTSWLMQMA
ncbi:uncharacterized protein [Nicotiana sylvestris]|uniref:uncharacterized protein n=1 Tax=Nicotiana sylvestris TaxID=4096 RepID=UPI00388CC05F